MAKLSNNKFNSIIVVAIDIYDQSNFICKNNILNKWNNAQYNKYILIKSTKALWKALVIKFNVKVFDMEKFVIDRFLDFKMIDSIFIMSSDPEFQHSMHSIYEKKIYL